MDQQVITKASAGRVADSFSFVLSHESVDRVGDIVVQRGIRLDSFLSNPVALLGHKSDMLPVGIWKNLRIQGDALLGDLHLAAKGTSKAADLARGLIEQGILRAVSVGFRPLKVEKLSPKGMKYLESELLEASLVSVPCHPKAVMIAKSLGMSPDEIKSFFTDGAELGNAGDAEDLAEGESARYKAARSRAVAAIIAANRTLRKHS